MLVPTAIEAEPLMRKVRKGKVMSIAQIWGWEN